MLANTLNTNEIKNAAGTEVEFQHLQASGRSRVFALINEPPSQKHRLTISHQETGSGKAMRRRSVVRFDKQVTSTVDSTTLVTISAYTVVDLPVGAMLAGTEFSNVLAELMSFLCTTGAGTTVLFDGSGNGANCLLTGGL